MLQKYNRCFTSGYFKNANNLFSQILQTLIFFSLTKMILFKLWHASVRTLKTKIREPGTIKAEIKLFLKT